LLVTATCRHLPPSTTSGDLAITNVTVIDVTRGTRLAAQTVLVAGTRIVMVGPARSVAVPGGARVVDGRGAFLVPGLWDMHVHSGGYDHGRRYLPALLAQGITGVRDMGTPLEDVLRLRAESRRPPSDDELPLPRVVVAGPLLNGPLPFHTPLILSVSTAREARAAVDSLVSRGVDFVKVHDALPRAEYFAIADEARRRGIAFAGHIPPSITADEATRAGQHSIEHLGGRFYGELLACSDREQALRAAVDTIVAGALRDMRAGRAPDDAAVFRATLTRPLVESFSATREYTRIGTIVAARQWEVPTLISQPLRDALSDATLRLTSEDRRWADSLLALQMRLVRDMRRAGVGLLAGTDRDIARPALADELTLLAAAGLTPLEVLRAATLDPALYLAATDSLGAVAPGKLADLVLLDADPLRDIGAIRRVRAVVANGRLLDEVERQRLVRRAAAGLRTPLTLGGIFMDERLWEEPFPRWSTSVRR
jgi:hypothetical protein